MSMSHLEKSFYSALLRSTLELLSAKPWLSLGVTDVFAVKDPASDEIVFVQVSGGDGDGAFELIAYRGAKGLEQLWEINNCENEAYIRDQSVDVTALFMSCVGSEDLDEMDQEILEDVEGLSPELGYPVFRSCRPGFQPGHMEEKEIALLTHVISQSYEVVKEIADGTLSLEVEEGKEDTYLLRTMQDEDAKVWCNERIDMNLDDKLPKKYPKLKRTELSLLKELPLGERELRMDLLVSPFTSGDEKEETPSTFLFMISDFNTGDLLCARIEEPGAKLPKFRESLLQTFQETLQRLGQRPKAVHVEAYSLCDMLGDVADKLELELKHGVLPAWRPAEAEAIMRHLGTRYTRMPGKIFF